MIVHLMSNRGDFRAAGGAGATAWVAYGVVEFVYVNAVRFIVAPEFAWLSGWYWLFNLVTFASYVAIGFVLGAGAYAVLGLFGRMADEERALRSRAATLLPMPVAFAVQLAVFRRRTDIAALFLVAVAALMTVGLLYAFLRGSRSGRFGRLWSPWRVAFVLVFLPWILERFHFKGDRPVILAVAGAILLVTVAQPLLGRGAQPLRAGGSWVAGLLAASCVGVAIAHTFWSPRLPEPTAATADPGAPNVVLIVLDTTRADHLSVYGYDRPTTRRLEEFARRATLYRRPVSPSNYTLPVHASLFTGLYPRRLGVERDPRSDPTAPLSVPSSTPSPNGCLPPDTGRWHSRPTSPTSRLTTGSTRDSSFSGRRGSRRTCTASGGEYAALFSTQGSGPWNAATSAAPI